MKSTEGALIDLSSAVRSPGRRALFKLVEPTVNRILSLEEVNRLYAQLSANQGQEHCFPAMLRALAIDYAEIEDDNKGMPVLLRYYLRLGARVLSFNVDPAFGNCVDGLVVADLRRTDPKLLKRFMGDDGYARYSAG